MNEDSTGIELIAIPIVGVIFGIAALVLFAAAEGPWAWILVGIGLLAVLALLIRRMTRRHPHMWNEAPPDASTRPGTTAPELEPAAPFSSCWHDGIRPRAV
jgi:hypothetical protein